MNKLAAKIDILTEIVAQRVEDLHTYSNGEDEANDEHLYRHLIAVHQDIQPKHDRKHYIKLAALCVGAIDALEKKNG